MNIDLQNLQNNYASKLGALEANNTLQQVQIDQLTKENADLKKQLEDLKAKQADATQADTARED
jgi:response regulator of citrate/malate metabolism